MVKSTLSAAAAARAAGFKTANPIFDAIRSGELPAERGPKGRNGRTTTNYRITPAALATWARSRGLELATNGVAEPADEVTLPAEPEPADAPVEASSEPIEAPVSNVAAIVPAPWAGVAEDRLALLVKLVKAEQLAAAAIVIEAWGL